MRMRDLNAVLFLARTPNDKPVTVVGTGNGSTTAQKSASPAPSSQPTAATSSSTTGTRSGSTNNTGMRQYSHRCPSKLALLLYIYV